MTNRDKYIAFFPSVNSMAANPYWPTLVEELSKSGYIVDEQTPSSFTTAWLIINRKKFRVLHIHYFQQFYKSSTLIKKLVKLILFAINMVFARVIGYRTVLTLHNLEGTYTVNPLWIDRIGHWVATTFSERVIVHCNEARRLLKTRYGRRNKVFQVDHPNLASHYPNQISKETARNRLNLSNNVMIFAFIGGIRPNKGIEILIKAFSNLTEENFRLLIAGQVFPPDSYFQSLEELATGDKRIRFYPGRIADEDLQIYLNAADIVVLPFSRILTSSSAILALSFKRPIIIPKMGCLPELIDPNGGWLYEPGDPGSLTNCLRIAAESDYTLIGLKGWKNIQKFTRKRFGLQTIEAYWI